MNLNDPVDLATIVVAAIAAAGLLGGLLLALAGRGSGCARTRNGPRLGDAPRSAVSPGIALSRAASYAGLAVVIIVAARAGVVGIGGLVALLGTIGILEWARLFDLPVHHRVSLVIANLVLVVAIGLGGVAVADWLVGGLVLVGAAWPVIRADTGRAVRDLGYAAVGFLVVPVFLVHGLALAVVSKHVVDSVER
jgi:hypothetical protein